jgi:IS5 family transposase
VDATLIFAPSSTKNAEGERDPEMKQTKKGNNWYFGMKAHIGVHAHSGLVHTVAGTAANVNDLNMAGALLHGDEEAAFGDAGYHGVHKRPEAAGPTWHVAMRRGLRRKLNPFLEPDFVAERVEKKASIRAKVEHPFRVIKRQFGFTKVRYRGLAKNTAQLDECARSAANEREARPNRVAHRHSVGQTRYWMPCSCFMLDQLQSHCGFCRPSLGIRQNTGVPLQLPNTRRPVEIS